MEIECTCPLISRMVSRWFLEMCSVEVHTGGGGGGGPPPELKRCHYLGYTITCGDNEHHISHFLSHKSGGR